MKRAGAICLVIRSTWRPPRRLSLGGALCLPSGWRIHLQTLSHPRSAYVNRDSFHLIAPIHRVACRNDNENVLSTAPSLTCLESNCIRADSIQFNSI